MTTGSQQQPTPEQEMLNWGRLLMDGLPFADLIAARDRATSLTWFDFWMGRADDYESMADTALEEGHSLTAGYWLWVGSMAAQYAQFLWFDERRPRGQLRKAELYHRAAPLLDPPAVRIDLPINDTTIVGTFGSAANTSYRIEFFSNPLGTQDASGYGEGQRYLGSTTVTTVNGGVSAMVRTLASELAPVRVNAVHPGIVGDSPAWEDKDLSLVVSRTPIGRTVTMDEIVGATLFLLDNGGVNGQNLMVEGGVLVR